MSDVKIIAFHLPQFHTIPENDAWWGEGFTEWTNVKKSKPLYPGHYQPRVPLNGNYYNLLDPTVQDQQADLARRYGIYGFCYYHYWFAGKKLLERPVEQILERGKPDFPFCLAWANEPWTRIWDGGDKHVLMPQSYGDPEQWRAHIRYLIAAFQDERYIKVEGKPMLLIYRSNSIRTMPAMRALWEEELHQAGFAGLHLVSMAGGFGSDPRVDLFDAYAEFEPWWTILNLSGKALRQEKRRRKLARFLRRRLGFVLHADLSYDYARLWRRISERILSPHNYPGAFADWDNSPRRTIDKAAVLRNFKPEAFRSGMKAQIDKAHAVGAEYLFFNAWNEWAEGTYLEPDEKRGHFFLETIREALNS